MMNPAQLADRALPILTKALQVAVGFILLGILFSGPFSPEISVTEKVVRYSYPNAPAH